MENWFIYSNDVTAIYWLSISLIIYCQKEVVERQAERTAYSKDRDSG